MGRDNMVADRVYWPGLLEAPNGRTTLLYFAAAVPTVGFVNGAADLNAVNAAALDKARGANRYGRSWEMRKRAASVLKTVASGPAVACLSGGNWWRDRRHRLLRARRERPGD